MSYAIRKRKLAIKVIQNSLVSSSVSLSSYRSLNEGQLESRWICLLLPFFMKNIVINVSWQLDSGLQAGEELSQKAD